MTAGDAAPFNRVARIAECLPVKPSIGRVTGFALQGFSFWRHHVGRWPVHFSGGKVVFTAVWKPGETGAEFERLIPVEFCPVTLFAGGLWLQQVAKLLESDL